jgi:hypothetical protein
MDVKAWTDRIIERAKLADAMSQMPQELNRRDAIVTGSVAGLVGLGLGVNAQRESEQETALLRSIEEMSKSSVPAVQKQALRQILELINKHASDTLFVAKLATKLVDLDMSAFLREDQAQAGPVHKKLNNVFLESLIKHGDFAASLRVINDVAANKEEAHTIQMAQGRMDKSQAMFALQSIIDPEKIKASRISDEQDPARQALQGAFNARLNQD